MRGHNPYAVEEPGEIKTRPASLESGLAKVESLVGDRWMSPYDGRHNYPTEAQRKRLSADDGINW